MTADASDQSPSRRALLLAGLGVVGFAAAAPVALVAALLRGDDGLLPAGTQVDGVDVGGLSPEDAVARLETYWTPYLANPVSFELGGRMWRPSAADVGLTVDYRGALRGVLAARGGGGITRRISEPPAAVDRDLVAAAFDPNVLRTYVTGIAQGFDQPAVDASVTLEGADVAAVRPGQTGRVVDIEAAVRAVGDLTHPTPPGRVVALTFREDVPAYTTDHARAALDEITRMTSAPLWLMHKGRGWTISPVELRAAIDIHGGGAELTPTLDFTRFNDLFTLIDDTLAAEPHPSVFDYDEAGNRVRAFQVGNPGQIVDRAALEQAMARAVASPDERVVEIPLTLLNTGADFAENPLGIRDLLAIGDSIYKGSPDYRLHNIAVGARKLDGLVVPAGETFSFLASIGPFELRHGWVEGSVILADKTEQGIGGGICQVSTTLFRAVLNAGLRIEERWPHLYRVRYYEMGPAPIGIDATIFSPGLDFKFRNDTEHPIMLRAFADETLGALTFEVWGVNDGRRVEIVDHELRDWEDPPPDQGIVEPTEDPEFEEQVEWSKRGVLAAFSRVIVWPDGSETRSTFRSSFVPWPNRYVVGIDVAKARFPTQYNEWFDENPEDAARWGVTRAPDVPEDPDAPAG